MLALFGLIQMFASISAFTFNSQSHTTKSLYYTSLMGMLTSFATGVYCCIQASEYNANTRLVPKHNDILPNLMPFYWWLQIASCVSLLFVFPMMLFIFYHKMGAYLKLQK